MTSILSFDPPVHVITHFDHSLLFPPIKFLFPFSFSSPSPLPHCCVQIASCDICSSGLGAKRRSKPPGQLRDVRSPAKLLKLSTSPFTVQSSIATAKPLQEPKQLFGKTVLKKLPPVGNSTSLGTSTKWSSATIARAVRETASEKQHNSGIPDLEDPSGSLDISLSSLVPTTSNTVTVASSDLTENTVNTPADDALLGSFAPGTVQTMSSGFQQIFTTIDEPTASEVVLERTPLSLPLSTSAQADSVATVVSSNGASTPTLQTISHQSGAQLSPETSIYNLLFKLPAEVNNDLFLSVVSWCMQYGLPACIHGWWGKLYATWRSRFIL